MHANDLIKPHSVLSGRDELNTLSAKEIEGSELIRGMTRHGPCTWAAMGFPSHSQSEITHPIIASQQTSANLSESIHALRCVGELL